MSNNLLHVTYILIVLSICIDRGDGRWKEKSKKNLNRDILLLREMAENVEREIEDFYLYYPDQLKDEDFYDQLPSFTKHNDRTKKGDNFFEFDDLESKSTQKYDDKTSEIKLDRIINKTPVKFMSENNGFLNNTKWPLFDDLLLSVGKKYDWKNDRWIKVKQRRRNDPVNVNINKPKADFVTKHMFNYRFVKINRSKSKRNVILAVKAVR